MNIIERIDESIDILTNLSGKYVNFNSELSLLNDIKKLLEIEPKEQKAIESYEKKVEELNAKVSVLEKRKAEVENNLKERNEELDKFRKDVLKELYPKMKMMGYSVSQLDFASKIETFEGLDGLREKIFYDYYKKFRYGYNIDNEPLSKIRYAAFKV